LDQLPDDTTLDDIQYHIYVRQKIDRGLDEVATGQTLSDEEFDARMATWLKP
jgi:predicted transcriptional regulator